MKVLREDISIISEAQEFLMPTSCGVHVPNFCGVQLLLGALTFELRRSQRTAALQCNGDSSAESAKNEYYRTATTGPNES